MTSDDEKKQAKRVLLIVDDEPLALRAIARLLRGRFDEILCAEDADEAEKFLNESIVSHILCDRWLGEGPYGEELLVKWKSQYGSLAFTALMTGEDVTEIEVPEEIDHVFPKPFDSTLLRSTLDKS